MIELRSYLELTRAKNSAAASGSKGCSRPRRRRSGGRGRYSRVPRPASLVFGGRQARHPLLRAGEGDAVASARRLHPERDREGILPVPGGPTKITFMCSQTDRQSPHSVNAFCRRYRSASSGRWTMTSSSSSSTTAQLTALRTSHACMAPASSFNRRAGMEKPIGRASPTRRAIGGDWRRRPHLSLRRSSRDP
jgi:hypothetical protein